LEPRAAGGGRPPAGFLRLRAVSWGLCLVVAGGWSTFGCQRGASPRPPGSSPTSGGGDSPVVARIDDVVITAADVQDRINKQSPFVRARYSDLEKRKEFLDNLIRFEVMAKEADKRGYAHDPEVERVMKQQMISKFLQKDFESKLRVEDVPDADVEKYYKQHAEEFNRPDEVRVSQLVVKDKARAEKLAGEARAAGSHADGKAFRELVSKYSEDEDSKARGGDLTSFDKTSNLYPRELVEAAFALKEVGDISPPVKTDKGYHVLRLTQKHPGFSRPLGEVKRQIQQRLFRDVRAKALDAFVADLKTKYAVSIDEANLAKVTIDSGDGQPAGMPRPPRPPGALGIRQGPGGALPGMPAPSNAPSTSMVSPAPSAPKAP
jgi:peptidyl-prolyl cis-trans isomerase C